MKTNFLTALVVVCISIAAGVSSNASAEDCTEAQAFNKMMALNRAQGRMMTSGPQTPQSPSIKLAMEAGSVGEVLAQKKYTEACAQYDALAVKYGVDLKKEMVGMVTYEELQKDGGKRGGECSLADASKKMMGLHQQLEDKAALGDVSRDVFRDFGKDTEKFGELMMTNPSEVCRQLDGLKVKYKLN